MIPVHHHFSWGDAAGSGRPVCLHPTPTWEMAMGWEGRAGGARGPGAPVPACGDQLVGAHALPAVRTAGPEEPVGWDSARRWEDGRAETVTGAWRRARCAGTNRAWQGFSDITREAPIPAALPSRLKINA